MTNLDNALVKLLSESLSDILVGSGRVVICRPAEPGDFLLGLYLYNIRPCTDINPPSVIRKGSSFQELSPHFLTLYYLVTAYSRADGVYKTAEDHRILFRAIQTFQNMPVLTERELGYRPGTYIDKLQVQMVELEPDEIANIWMFRESEYRLSVAYKITPVEVSAEAGSFVTRVSDTNFKGIQR